MQSMSTRGNSPWSIMWSNIRAATNPIAREIYSMGSISAHQIAQDFTQAAALAGVHVNLSDIHITEQSAPHVRPSLGRGKFAVYVFLYREHCLKVGKAGPKSAARFTSQHYGMAAPSTLAKSLLGKQAKIGLTHLTEANVAEWILNNTSRINFLLPATYPVAVLSLFEAFVQCRLDPIFEGFDSQRTPALV